MRRKFLLTLVALVVALGCALGLVACGDDTKVKDEAQWKQKIADMRQSDKIGFSAIIKDNKDRVLEEIQIEALGKTQHLWLCSSHYDAEDNYSEDFLEYFYDGEYVYYYMTEKELDYTWQKVKANTVENFIEPLNYIDMIYSGELLREMGYNVTFDNLDKVSERYADAVYNEEKNYVITDGNSTYNVRFEPNRMVFEINSGKFYLSHDMGSVNQALSIPTESVQEVGNTGN